MSLQRWYNSYTWWWSRFGGRPWTYIIRDWWHEYEFLWILALIAIGAALGKYYWDQLWVGLAIFAAGYLFGHLFWGTRWRKGQRNN